MRLLGVSMDASINFRREPGGKNAGLLAALDRRWEVVGVVRPELGTLEDAARKLIHLRPDRNRWRRAFNLDPAMFQRRTALVERALVEWEGRFDLIVQVHTVFAPGTGARPYVLHTDTNYRLTERHYPEGAPLHGSRRQRWLDLEGAVYRNASFVFPRSEWLRRSLIEDYGCDPARVVRVGGGVNLAGTLEGKRWDTRTAIFVGLDFPRKGGPGLLRAWSRVRARLPDARLVIVGVTGPETAGVEWLGEVRDRARLAGLYQQATVFVMPSVYEPWGHVFYEAMASGLACVGARACAMPEIIREGVTGTLVTPEDDDELANALLAHLDPATAEEMGRAAFREVQTGHSWDDVVARMAAVLSSNAAPRAGEP